MKEKLKNIFFLSEKLTDMGSNIRGLVRLFIGHTTDQIYTRWEEHQSY